MGYGIEINLYQLNHIAIANDGKKVTIGGGVIARNLTDTLWAAGKQTGTYLTGLFGIIVAAQKNLDG